MVENQHRLITGYNDLDQDKIDLINRIKQAEYDYARVWWEVKQRPDVDQRWIALARTHVEEGTMVLIRSVGRAESGFERVMRENMPEPTGFERVEAERTLAADDATFGEADTADACAGADGACCGGDDARATETRETAPEASAGTTSSEGGGSAGSGATGGGSGGGASDPSPSSGGDGGASGGGE